MPAHALEYWHPDRVVRAVQRKYKIADNKKNLERPTPAPLPQKNTREPAVFIQLNMNGVNPQSKNI